MLFSVLAKVTLWPWLFSLRKQWTIACPHQTAAAEAVKAWVRGLFAVCAMVLKPFHQKI